MTEQEFETLLKSAIQKYGDDYIHVPPEMCQPHEWNDEKGEKTDAKHRA